MAAPSSSRPLVTVLVALGWTVGSTGVGLTVNALRGDGLAVVAPFPYELDCPDKLKSDASPIAAAEARSLLAAGRALLVDARPAEDFAAGHLPGARSLPYSFVTPLTAEGLGSLPRDRVWLVYCDTPGDRLAALQAEQMRRAGHVAVRVLAGGLESFAQAAGAAPRGADAGGRAP
ncbi:MAG: rhodanese-like domain-containing protein [Deltaproteobacteria bacterium]|nr:rhodanese-like domain-containing protein [Deltaproteobacteria bacterium]